MWEIVTVSIAAVLATGIYARSERPVLYAFYGIMTGAVSLIAAELIMKGTLDGITPYNAALSAILGVPGTTLHIIAGMLN